STSRLATRTTTRPGPALIEISRIVSSSVKGLSPNEFPTPAQGRRFRPPDSRRPRALPVRHPAGRDPPCQGRPRCPEMDDGANLLGRKLERPGPMGRNKGARGVGVVAGADRRAETGPGSGGSDGAGTQELRGA